MKIAIGCDHAGFPYKDGIVAMLQSQGHMVLDFGTNSFDSVDYPDFAHAVSESVASQQADRGILLCGSGNGVAITANKHQEIRCALCWTEEIAQLLRTNSFPTSLERIPVRHINYQNQTPPPVYLENYGSSSFGLNAHGEDLGKRLALDTKLESPTAKLDPIVKKSDIPPANSETK